MTAARIYIALGALLFSFLLGMFSEHKLNLASQVAGLYDQITTTHAAQVGANTLVGQTNVKKETLASTAGDIKEKINEDLIKHPSGCMVSDTSFRLLKSAADAARGSSK